MTHVLDCPLVLLLLSEAICLFPLLLLSEAICLFPSMIQGSSLEFCSEKVLKSNEFLILGHNFKLFCLYKFFPICFRKTLVSQSEVGP